MAGGKMTIRKQNCMHACMCACVDGSIMTESSLLAAITLVVVDTNTPASSLILKKILFFFTGLRLTRKTKDLVII